MTSKGSCASLWQLCGSHFGSQPSNTAWQSVSKHVASCVIHPRTANRIPNPPLVLIYLHEPIFVFDNLARSSECCFVHSGHVVEANDQNTHLRCKNTTQICETALCLNQFCLGSRL